MDEITFAVPYYSGLELLERTLASIVGQRDPTWSAVVCDDSDDPAVEPLVARVGGGRIRYARNASSLGMAGNFNRCLEIAETPLVTILHADDELGPGYAATMRAAAARHPDAVAMFCRAEIIGPDSQPWFSLADVVKRRFLPSSRDEIVLEGEPGMRVLLAANFIVAPTLCFRKSLLGAHRFPTNRRFVMDWELTTGLLLAGESIVGLPVVEFRYRRHADNATERLTKTQHRFLEESELYDRMRVVALERGWEECARIAERKRIVKLNVAYRALKSAVRLQWRDAARGVRLLVDLSR